MLELLKNPQTVPNKGIKHKKNYPNSTNKNKNIEGGRSLLKNPM